MLKKKNFTGDFMNVLFLGNEHLHQLTAQGKYNLNDAEIVVQGGTHCGMATIFDYDIFLYMVSYLTHEMNKVREEIIKLIIPTRLSPLPTRFIFIFVVLNRSNDFSNSL
jgi:hypothetical protein